ncbi:MAG: exodeoxyribonuclease VII large subunit [Lachnoclostridium sp.]|nr:exodeoxyribonuclease VII large subunit [Lachnoclostridium sp.]
MTGSTDAALTLLQFNTLLSEVIASAPALRSAWVVAETSDLRRSTHCYLELIQKNPDTGETVARARATIWRTTFQQIDADFYMATGQRLDSGMKVMVKVSANYHPAYGLSLNITAINPSYTLGDLMRLRREILARLTAEGVVNLNRRLPFPLPALNIAVISAEGAAGYGDFMRHLFDNPHRINFKVQLFPALMQGVQAPASIINALDQIAEMEGDFDCVVIIRGGGATSDLASFENYDLAANIAQFPLPVIIGIGHERDITVLDYVANTRVKTPTAAAQLLITQASDLLQRVDNAARAITVAATSMMAATREQLAYIASRLPFLPSNIISSTNRRLDSLTMRLITSSRTALTPVQTRLDRFVTRLASATSAIIDRRRNHLDALARLAEALSPQATLSRGYSITRVEGHAVISPDQIPEGATVTTTLAGGTVILHR